MHTFNCKLGCCNVRARMCIGVLSAIALSSVALAAPNADEITALPGWTAALPSKQCVEDASHQLQNLPYISVIRGS